MIRTTPLFCKSVSLFNAKLLEVTNSRGKNVSHKKALHASVQNFLDLSKEFGSTVTYAITMTFPY